ncbi:cell division protein FtsA [Thiomicrorhabdus indica]|uniref:cell division protein FtsA n=1 Tax=Thiomicrorhabdus indica TaxID=2267253 RepID=UPI0019811023|nr:cell division protein FtsA [Thiomicrorhabdus indica]
MNIRHDQNASDVVVGLDIGTSKIAAIVGKLTNNGQVEVLGIGTYPSVGMKKGVVVNIEATVDSIREAVTRAENTSGISNIKRVLVGVSGSHIQSINSHGTVAIPNKEVSHEDIDRVMQNAQTIKLPSSDQILHVMPQSYTIDGQEGIREPLGMSGVRLEANAHIVTGSASALSNITKCVERCGLEVDGLVLEQLASSDAVLSEDEKELGVCLVDIGAGTTDIAIYHEGAICHTHVFPVGGDQVTGDIAYALRTPTQAANDIKVKYACAHPQAMHEDEDIEVPSVGDRVARCLSRKSLVGVVGPRYAEIFEMVEEEISKAGYANKLAAGVVLTGGSSQVQGLVELAEETMSMQVRMGFPMGITGMLQDVCHPEYATTVGLLLYARDNLENIETIQPHQEIQVFEPEQPKSSAASRFFNYLKDKF